MAHANRFWLTVLALLMAVPAALAEEQPATDAAVESDSADPREAYLSGLSAEEGAQAEAALAEHEAETRAVAEARGTAMYRFVRKIAFPNDVGCVRTFCPLADGGLVIATGPQRHHGEDWWDNPDSFKPGDLADSKKKSPAHRLVWQAADGKERRAVPLTFPCNGVTVAPDGAVIAAGGDRILVFDADGREVAVAEAPHFVVAAEERAAIEEEIIEQHDEMVELLRKPMADLESAIAKLEAIPEAERTPRQGKEIESAKDRARQVGEMIVTLESARKEYVIARGLAAAREIVGVAASRDHLFIVASEAGGLDYGVWRCGRDFSNPEKIVGDLDGCCGQMDVQVIGDELVIAENGRHTVRIVGHDGSPRRTFGEASRTDPTKGFGGCCNPMNSCPGPDGSLLLSESEGLVKQFSPDGRFLGIFGGVESSGGCNNGTIGLSADGSRLYFLDGCVGVIFVMEKKS